MRSTPGAGVRQGRRRAPAEIGEESRRLPVGDLVALLAGGVAERVGEMVLAEPHGACQDDGFVAAEESPGGQVAELGGGNLRLYGQSKLVRVVSGSKRAAATWRSRVRCALRSSSSTHRRSRNSR